MARIAGVLLPAQKRIEAALPYIYGIGLTLSKTILSKTGINPDTRVKDLSERDTEGLRKTIEGQYRVEGELKRDVLSNIKRLKEIGSYRGMRHSKGLPVRGQHTKTNTRTIRGNVRRTMGSGRKPAAQKT